MPDALDTDKLDDLIASMRHDEGCSGVFAGQRCRCNLAESRDAAKAQLAEIRARAERMERALRQFADCDLHDGNCASLEIASRRIRNLARTALALPAADRRAENDKHE